MQVDAGITLKVDIMRKDAYFYRGLLFGSARECYADT